MTNNYQSIDLDVFKLFLLLYADDIVLLSETESGLQEGLLLLEGYCDRWKLSVNSLKTKVMIFRKGGRLRRNLTFLYKGQELEIVDKFTYLGIVFTPGGSFTNTFDTLSGQAMKAIYKLRQCLSKFPTLSVKHRLEIFDKLIYPVLSYGSEVWGLFNSPQLERVHLNFCKELLGVRTQTQNNFVYGELGRTSLFSRRSVNVIRYWLKIVNMQTIKYVRIVYNKMYMELDRNNNNNNKSWVYMVRNLLQRLGFNDVWLNQGLGRIDLFLHVFKQRVTDTFIQSWTA